MASAKKSLSPWEWGCHFIPALRWLPTYDWRTNLAGDVIAALTVTAVAAPEAVSYAGIAGLPAETGLNTGFLGPLAYAVAGASPQLIVGPTAIMCILTGNAIPATWGGQAVGNGSGTEITVLRVRLAALLALFVGMIQAFIGVLRLGGVVSLVSTPVVAGFTTGSALLTASSQFATLLGLPKCKGAGGGSCTFAEAIGQIVDSWGSIKWSVFAMSCVCVTILVAVKYGPSTVASATGRKLHPAWKVASSLAPLVLVFITVPILATAMDLKELEAWGLTPPKPIPSGAPTPLLPFGDGSGLDKGSQSDYIALLTAAFPLAVIGYMGAVTITKTVARQDGPYPTDPQQEIWGQVAANAACAIGQGLPVTGSFSRTAVNSSSGARTALASALTGALMAIALQTLTGVLSLVPDVARSAIVIVAIGKMIELSLLPKLWRQDRRDFLAFAATLLVVLFKDASTGLLAGVTVHWFLALTRSAGAQSRVRLLAWVPEGGRATDADADAAGGGAGSGASSALTLPGQDTWAQSLSSALVDALDSEGAVARLTSAGSASGRTSAGVAAGRTVDITTASSHAIPQGPPISMAWANVTGLHLTASDSSAGGDGVGATAGQREEDDHAALLSGHSTLGFTGHHNHRTGDSGTGGTHSPPPSPHALLLTFSPDLQFPNAERLAAQVTEACALFSRSAAGSGKGQQGQGPGQGRDDGRHTAANPAPGPGLTALILNLTSCHAVDSTGAAALLAAAEDAVAAGVPLILACGLSAQGQAVVRATAAEAESSGKGKGVRLPAGVPTAVASQAVAGHLLLLPAVEQGLALAQVACARAILGWPVVASAGSSGSTAGGKGEGEALVLELAAAGAGAGGASAPLLGSSGSSASASSSSADAYFQLPADGGEEEGEHGGSSGSGSAGGGKSKGKGKAKARVPVQGVPLSPLVRASQEARRRRPIGRAAEADAAAAAGDGGGAGQGKHDTKAAAPLPFPFSIASALASAAVQGWREVREVVGDDARPLFVA